MPTTYKCPSCGAAMEFDSDTQKMKCPQCQRIMDVSEFDMDAADGNYDENTGFAGEGYEKESYDGESTGGTMNMKTYHCTSCGAELLADEYTSAVICSFCGNPSLVEDRLKGEFKPSTIIPFKINKDKAVEIYKNWCKKGLLTPSALSRNSTIEKISGLYVPYWLYDYSAQTDMHANAERVRTTRKGDTEYIYTDHFQVFRNISAKFEKIPADASEKMPDDANWWNYSLRHTKQFGDNRYYITNIIGTVGRMYHHEHYRYLICESKDGETKVLLDFKKGFYRSALMVLFWMTWSIGGPALIFGHQFEVVKRLKKWLSE